MKSVKIGFVLLSNHREPIPSTRISVLNMLPFLRTAGFEPHIVFEPEVATETPDVSGLAQRLVAQGFQIIYFQKVHGVSVEAAARDLSSAGVRTVYGVCDLISAVMTEVTDATTTVTDYLRDLYPERLRSKVHVVHDGIERPDIFRTTCSANVGSRARPLRAVLVTSANLDCLPIVGSPPSWLEVRIVGRYPPRRQVWQRLRERRWQWIEKDASERMLYLQFLMNPRIRCIQWDAVGVYDEMTSADIGIIPTQATDQSSDEMSAHAWMIKSENRLTMKMSVGLPVVATAIPAYESVISQAQNGFLARSTREWFEYLNLLRDPALRHAMGKQARDSVSTRYSMHAQARSLIRVLNQLV